MENGDQMMLTLQYKQMVLLKWLNLRYSVKVLVVQFMKLNSNSLLIMLP
jgi:hypothetical protein